MITVRCPTMAALAGLCAGVHVPIVVEAVDDMRPAVALPLRSHGWFGAKVFVFLVATIVAAYVTAKLL